MKALETKGISKHFEGVHAIDQLSIVFEKGKITGLIGPNGSGKSTLINMLTGITSFDNGEFATAGFPITKLTPPQAYEQGITRTFQEIRLFEQMSVLDNLLVVLTKKKVHAAFFETQTVKYRERAKQILKNVGLWEHRAKLAKSLSYGQRKLLEIARVIAMANGFGVNSTIIFLDEPFAGLFSEMRTMLRAGIKELQQQGKTIIIVEHSIDIIRELCNWVIVLDSGTLLAQGSPDTVLNRPEVIEAYIGKK